MGMHNRRKHGKESHAHRDQTNEPRKRQASSAYPPDCCPLANIPPGTQVRIVEVAAGDGLRARLAALGLFPGALCKVVSNSGWGPFVVAVRNTRMLLGRGMVEKIHVQALSPSLLAQ